MVLYAILRARKHKTIGSLKGRESHTFRTRPTPNADPAKLKLNKILFGREDYAKSFSEKLAVYEKTNHVRSDAVLGIEYFIGATHEFFTQGTIQEQKDRLVEWYETQLKFLIEKHGEENVVCVILHLDEKTPHIEAFVLPIDKKARLNCKFYLGGSKRCSELQTEYAAVNAGFGLKRGVQGSRATHQKVTKHYTAINQPSEISNEALTNALKLDKPTFIEKLNMDDYLAKQEKQLHRRMTEMFLPIVEKAKLVERAEQLVEIDKKREEKMKAEKLTLENTIHRMKEAAEEMLAPLRMIESLQYQIAEQKKN